MRFLLWQALTRKLRNGAVSSVCHWNTHSTSLSEWGRTDFTISFMWIWMQEGLFHVQSKHPCNVQILLQPHCLYRKGFSPLSLLRASGYGISELPNPGGQWSTQPGWTGTQPADLMTVALRIIATHRKRLFSKLSKRKLWSDRTGIKSQKQPWKVCEAALVTREKWGAMASPACGKVSLLLIYTSGCCPTSQLLP